MTWLLRAYVPLIVLWGLLSWWVNRHNHRWNFTPSWHLWGVRGLRTVFLATLPLEFYLRGGPLIETAYWVGLAGTVVWLGVRFAYLWRSPRPFPPGHSLLYNTLYLVNLISFSILMQSFVCLAILIQVSTLALLVRLHVFLKQFPRGNSRLRTPFL